MQFNHTTTYTYVDTEFIFVNVYTSSCSFIADTVDIRVSMDCSYSTILLVFLLICKRCTMSTQ